MKLNTLEVTARGRTTRLDFTSPVTILSAQNGAGKSTVLTGLELALKGAITVDGKPRKQPGDIFAHLSAAGAPVGVTAAFDCASIARTLTKTATGATQTLHFSGAPGAKNDVAQGAIIATIGDLARVDVADLLSKGPTDRRAAILGLCRTFAKPWKMDDLRTAWEAAAQQETGYDADGPAFAFTPDAQLDLLASLERDALAAKEAVATADKEIKRLQAAIDANQSQASAQAESGDAETMKARIDALNAEIQRLSAEAAAIEGANQNAATIERRLGELAQLPHAERARADVAKAREAYAGALAERAVLSPPSAPAEPSDIADLRRQVEEHDALISRARFEAEQFRKSADSLQSVVDHAGAWEDCPTCHRPMDEGAVAALGASIKADRQIAGNRDHDATEATDVRDCLKADLDDATKTHAAAMDAFNKARADYAGAVACADADIATKKRATTDAETLLRQCESATAERAELGARRAGLATGDADMLHTQIAGAAAERSQLSQRRDAVLQDAARVKAYRDQVLTRDELKATLPALKAAAEAWRTLVNQVGESAIKPFVEACTAALPSGWALTFDLDAGDFRVVRGDVSVPFSALSGGERVMAVAAMAVALAKCAGNPWRAVILDDCERIMGDDWRDPDYPDGLFAAFVGRLAEAARAGLVDQVFMATSRRLDGAEGAAIRGVAQVVEMGAPLPPPGGGEHEHAGDGIDKDASPDDSLPWSAPDVPTAELPRAKAIREAFKGMSGDAAAYLYEEFSSIPPKSTAATVKRVAQERCTEMAETTDRVLALIAKAKEMYPVRVRGASVEEVVA